jgi:hypothetical protein
LFQATNAKVGLPLKKWPLVIAAISLMVQYSHKVRSDSVPFMTQPCHLMTGILLLMPLLPPRVRNFVMNVFICLLWLPFVALVHPDHRDHLDFVEFANFYVEHVLLVTLPFYWVKEKFIDLYEYDFKFTCLSFTIASLYHVLVLETVGLLSSTNLNYMFNPPTGILESFGKYYRVFMFTLGLALTFVNGRFVVPRFALKKEKLR